MQALKLIACVDLARVANPRRGSTLNGAYGASSMAKAP
jgi:hypothetical protein